MVRPFPVFISSCLLVVANAVFATGSWAATITHPVPFSRLTGAMLFMVIIDIFLVGVLLACGFMVLNLGLLSKRREDRIGHSEPGDLHVLHTSIWPDEPEDLAAGE